MAGHLSEEVEDWMEEEEEAAPDDLAAQLVAVDAELAEASSVCNTNAERVLVGACAMRAVCHHAHAD